MWRLCPSAPLWSRVLCRAHLVPDKLETPELFVLYQLNLPLLSLNISEQKNK